MNLFRRIFNRYAPPADEPAESLSKADRVVDILNRDWFFQAGGLGAVPRGTITAIAREAGCSQGYVSRLAKANGYRVGKSDG